MPSDGSPLGRQTRRLHPLSLLFSVGGLARNLLLPGIVVLFFASRGGGGEAWFMLLFIPAVVGALFQYVTYRYRFDRDELVIREGVVFRNERHIPYARIQNIDLVQNPLHRLLRVAEVRLETAGGQKPEAVMRVLSLHAVRHMRVRVFEQAERADAAERGSAAGEAEERPAENVLHSMRTADVVLFGLISNKGMVVVAAALGLMWQFDLFDWEDSWVSRESLERYARLLPRDNILGALVLALVVVALVLVLMRVLSVVWALGKFHGFRLTRRSEDLRAEFGLLTRVSKTIPRHRIQVLSTREGFLHRRCGRVAVQIETAGSAGEDRGSSADRLWLAPLMRKELVDALVREALPDVELEAVRWQPISPRARRRLLRIALYLSAVVTAPAVWIWGLPGLALLLALVPLAWLNARQYVEHTGYALVPGAIFFKSGWWNRRLSIARFSKIQALERGESPFDRRHGMASVRVDTAGATRTGHSFDILFLDAEVATQLAGRLYLEAGRTAFRW